MNTVPPFAAIDLSQDSLEKLCIAVMDLRSSQGLRIALHPTDVLQPWVTKQLPRPISSVESFNEFLGAR